MNLLEKTLQAHYSNKVLHLGFHKSGILGFIEKNSMILVYTLSNIRINYIKDRLKRNFNDHPLSTAEQNKFLQQNNGLSYIADHPIDFSTSETSITQTINEAVEKLIPILFRATQKTFIYVFKPIALGTFTKDRTFNAAFDLHAIGKLFKVNAYNLDEKHDLSDDEIEFLISLGIDYREDSQLMFNIVLPRDTEYRFDSIHAFVKKIQNT